MKKIPRWTELEEKVLLREMDALGDMSEKKKAKKLHRKHLLPGRSVQGMAIHHLKLLKTLGRIVDKLDADNRPLMRMMALLDKAKDNGEAWGQVFPKALHTVEDVYADIEAARKELEKMSVVYKAKQKLDADDLSAEMDECDAELKKQKLVDREVKRGG
jgi:hypothetical protein